MENTILATFAEKASALAAARQLLHHEVPVDALTLVAADSEAARGAVREVEELRESRHVRSATLGFSLFGAGLGTAVGGLSMVIPIVPLLAVGGGAAFGLAGRVAAMALAREREEDLSRLLTHGGMLLLVHTEDEAQAQEALSVLSDTHARDVHVAA